MSSITVGSIECLAITKEIADYLISIGEDITKLNKIEVPWGASQFTTCTVLISDDNLSGIQPDLENDVIFNSGQSSHTFKKMFLMSAIPIVETFSAAETMARPLKSFYKITLVDARYSAKNFQMKNTSDNMYNVTKSTDRSQYLVATTDSGTPFTWQQLLTQVISSASILTTVINPAVFTPFAGNVPQDFIWSGVESVPVVIDRICARLGAAFVYDFSTGNYAIDIPSNLSWDYISASNHLISGGCIWDGSKPPDSDNVPTSSLLSRQMPGTVIVNFPMDWQTQPTDTNFDSSLYQFFTSITTSGKPTGYTGNIGGVYINDLTWATPVDPTTGIPGNSSTLNTLATKIAASYYARWKTPNVAATYSGFGFPPSGVIGTLVFQSTYMGIVTHINTGIDWYLYGAQKQVLDFNGNNKIIGTGNILAYKSFDGSIFITDTVPPVEKGVVTTPPTVGGETTESAATDSWDITMQPVHKGVNFIQMTRAVYNASGDQILYGFNRTLIFNSLGQLQSISAETRFDINTPSCETT